MLPYLVLGLPRSRTFWLAKFLSRPERMCEHDPSVRFRSRRDVEQYFWAGGAAATDTALSRIWPSFDLSHVLVVVVHRPLFEVCASLRRLGLPTEGMAAAERQLAGIRGMHIKAADLDEERIAEAVYQACTGRLAPAGRWREMIGRNLQCDAGQVAQAAAANQNGIRALFGAGGSA